MIGDGHNLYGFCCVIDVVTEAAAVCDICGVIVVFVVILLMMSWK